MPATEKIKMRLSTTNPSDHRAPLEDFAKACTALQKCLAGVAKCLGREHVSTPITNLAFSSALIEVDTDADVATAFDDTVAAFEEGRSPDDRLDYPTLQSFKRFAATAKKPGLSLELGNLRLTSRYVTNVRAALEHSRSELGSVSGRLEAFNVHAKPTFTLYPPVPNEHVECQFDETQLSRVLAAVAKHVTVFGALHYRRGKAFPSRVYVEDFMVNPDDGDLPTLLERHGLPRSANPEPGPTSVEGDCIAWFCRMRTIPARGFKS